MRKFLLKAVISISLLVAWVIPVSADNYVTPDTKIIFLGDSLMDTGNNFLATAGDLFQIPHATRYYSGRFSNGPITPDYLARMLGICDDVKPSLSADFFTDFCVSFAFGGSGTGEFDPTPGGFPVPGLLIQATMLAAEADFLDDRTLIVVWTGPNDLFLQTRTPEQSVDNIILALENLIDIGGKNLVVMNVPNLGKTPLAGENARVLFENTKRFNKRLKNQLHSLMFSHQGISILGVNTYKQFNLLFTNPGAFGFSDDLGAGPAAGCLFFEIAPDCSSLHDGFETDFIFWDELHPTTQAHYKISTFTSLLISSLF